MEIAYLALTDQDEGQAASRWSRHVGNGGTDE